jgi:subtilisin family serine protease
MLQGRGLTLLCAGLAFASLAHAKDFPAVPGQFVVKMKHNLSATGMRALTKTLNADKVELITPESQALLVTRSAVETAAYSLQSLHQAAGVEYAEPNYIYKINGFQGTPNDAKFGVLWGMNNTGQLTPGNSDEGTPDVQGVPGVDIGALQAWMIETGSKDVKIAVIDTGIDYTIPDLVANVWTNQVELNGKAGVDDDNNGCIDDIHGCNFVANTGDPKDDHGHGSHVSGTIGASGNNGIGVVGVAWDTTIVGVKFLDASGSGSLDNAVKGIDYATRVGVKIMSNSWGGGGFSQAMLDSINRAKDAGILFIAAAGNAGSDNDATPAYPASYAADNIISVAAIDAAGNLADFSCYGKTTVHVAAPGEHVLSNVPTTTDASGFTNWSGTSMATPHVTGVAALLISQHPEQTYATIKARILAGARPFGSLRGKMVSAGMVNAYYSLTDTAAPKDVNDPFYWPATPNVVSTPHPYAANTKQSWTLNAPGAAKIAIHFSKFDTEQGFDVVTLTDKNGTEIAKISGTKGEYYTPVINGDTVTITLASDGSVQNYGFDIAEIMYQSSTSIATK